MTGALAGALWSYWRRAPLQLVSVLVGLALATALWSGVQAINAEARASYDAAARTLGESQFDQLVPRVGKDLDQEVYLRLRRAGWQVSPVIEGRLPQGGARIVGLEPLTAPGNLVPVTAPDGTGTIDLASFLQGTLALAAPNEVRRMADATGLDVVAMPGIGDGIVVMDIGTAQKLLDRSARITRMVVSPNQPTKVLPLATIAPEVLVRAASAGSDVGQLTGSFHLNLTAFGLLSFIVGLFIVHGAVRLSFEQRRSLVRSLRAMGTPMRAVVVGMALEIVLLALIGGTSGIVLGYILAGLLLPDVAATLDGLYGASVADQVQLRASWIVAGLGMALAGALAAAASGLWRIANLPVLASARPQAWVGYGSRQMHGLAWISFVLLSASGLALGFGSGLLLGFGGLACLLIGAALALPPLLQAGVGWIGRRSRSVLGQWFWADTAQQVPGLGLALMALMLATATNIGVSTMVSSFRLTFEAFLDQRLAPELFVQVETEAQALSIEGLPVALVSEVLPLRSVEARVMGQDATVFGVRVGKTYQQDWQLLSHVPDPWQTVQTGQGAVINEQLSYRLEIGAGDLLELMPGHSVSVAGIVADYGNPMGQVILEEDAFTALFNAPSPRRFGLRSHDPDALRRVLLSDLGLPAGAVTDQRQIKSFSLDVFDRTFSVTAALNVLTLCVAGFAMLMSLLTLGAQRLPQVAPVWAMGVTRRSLGLLELVRALALAGLTVVLALPLGLALAWVLLAVVNVEAFGWRLPFFLFPGAYLNLALAACLAAVCAAAWPAWRMSKVPPAQLLKVFANDR